MLLLSSASDANGVLLVGVRHFKMLVMSLEGFENGFWTNTIPLLELACFPAPPPITAGHCLGFSDSLMGW